MRTTIMCAICAILAFFTLLPGVTEGAGATGAPDLISFLEEARDGFKGVRDYTAMFHKQQRVRGDLHDEELMAVKFRKPFQVYMKWVGAEDHGREVLYVRGKHNNKIVARAAGMLGFFSPTVSIHPLSRIAMTGNLRPITESGMVNTIRLLLEVCEKAKRNGDLKVLYLGEGRVGDRTTYLFERVLPQVKGYPAHRSLIEIDQETKFPLSVKSYGWEGELLEKYIYKDMKINAGLGDNDFDYHNSEYGFGNVIVPIPSE